MITILETLQFKNDRALYHIGCKDGVLYYGEEYSQIMWMTAEKFLSDSTGDFPRMPKVEKIISTIRKYERDNKLNGLGI